MSCHNTGRAGSNKKKRTIAIISGAGVGVAGIAYVSLAANPVAAAAIPAVLAFAACPAMCAAMGGAMWMSRRFKKRNNNSIMQTQPLNNNAKELATKNLEVESQSVGDNNNEIFQVQYQNKLKRKVLKRKMINMLKSIF
jgi:hypothetical protein